MIIATIKLNLIAGQASINPPIGPMLGQFGLNLMLFCKEYNRLTEKFKGLKIPVSVYIMEDRSFKLKLHMPPISFLISKYSLIKNNKKILTLKNLKKILLLKRIELYPNLYSKFFSMVKGTLKSMNVYIINE